MAPKAPLVKAPGLHFRKYGIIFEISTRPSIPEIPFAYYHLNPFLCKTG